MDKSIRPKKENPAPAHPTPLPATTALCHDAPLIAKAAFKAKTRSSTKAKRSKASKPLEPPPLSFPRPASSEGLGTTSASGSTRKRRKRSAKLYAIQRDRSHEFNLMLDINDLQQEIQSLKMFKQLLYSRSLGASTLHHDTLQANVIREFSSLFRFGYREFDDQQQREFLHSAFHEEIDCGEGIVGIDTLCDQFRAIDITIPKIVVDMDLFKFQFVRADNHMIVMTCGQFEGVLTRCCLETMFPQILNHEHLVQKVMGRVITCPVKWRFVFDEHGKVVCFEAEIDYVGPFTKLLKDLGQVSLVLGGNMDWRVVPSPSSSLSSSSGDTGVSFDCSSPNIESGARAA